MTGVATGVANFMLKSWCKTSAYEIRTFQYGSFVLLNETIRIVIVHSKGREVRVRMQA